MINSNLAYDIKCTEPYCDGYGCSDCYNFDDEERKVGLRFKHHGNIIMCCKCLEYVKSILYNDTTDYKYITCFNCNVNKLLTIDKWKQYCLSMVDSNYYTIAIDEEYNYLINNLNEYKETYLIQGTCWCPYILGFYTLTKYLPFNDKDTYRLVLHDMDDQIFSKDYNNRVEFEKEFMTISSLVSTGPTDISELAKIIGMR